MQRRSFLAGAAIAGLQTLALPLTGSRANTRPRIRHRVRPGDPQWPSASAWNQLNTEVEGNLTRASPLLEPCIKDAANAACHDVLANLRNPLYIGDQPGGTQVSGWVDAWEPAPGAYVVAVDNAAEVAAAVNFAREQNLRLVVKGGGHSYQGTSNAPDSLLIWTRKMNRIQLHATFVAQGCLDKTPPQPAVTLESGALWIDAYDAVTTQAGRYVQGGGGRSWVW